MNSTIGMRGALAYEPAADKQFAFLEIYTSDHLFETKDGWLKRSTASSCERYDGRLGERG